MVTAWLLVAAVPEMVSESLVGSPVTDETPVMVLVPPPTIAEKLEGSNPVGLMSSAN